MQGGCHWCSCSVSLKYPYLHSYSLTLSVIAGERSSSAESIRSAVQMLYGMKTHANEKLRPWGFWVHGCIDGHSRFLIYVVCCNNKRSATVTALFLDAVKTFGWPSRVRGDFGTENNGVERAMVAKWGVAHRAYLRGR